MPRQTCRQAASTRTTFAGYARHAKSWRRQHDGLWARILPRGSATCFATRCSRLVPKMSKTSSSEQIREHILDLVWSLWAELGVSSWIRRHQQWAIDPEPLILFTVQIGDADRRLRDEALDWCI